MRFSDGDVMSSKCLGLFVTFGLALTLFSVPAPAQPGAGAVLPPSFCDGASCSRGMQLYATGRFTEAAAVFEEALEGLPAGELGFEGRVDLLLLSAAAWERAQSHARAGMAYLKASRLLEELRPFLEFKAAESLAQVDQPDIDMLARIDEGGALERGYAGSTLVAARIDAARTGALPSTEHVERALQSTSREQTCEWLSGVLVAGAQTLSGDEMAPGGHFYELSDRVYGYCLPEETHEAFPAEQFEPSALMHARRADRLYWAVRFPDAYAELAEVDFDTLDEVDRCRARFRLARTQFRLRQRTRAVKTYKKVIESCTDEQNEDQRVSAIYAVGKILHGRKKRAESEEQFDMLLEEYAHRSHADDALLYLARIARAEKRTKREKRLVERALAEYPDGDMVHEIVWEHLEGAYRAGDHKAFLARLGELDLPDFDHQYFSQGRLAYFSGRAWQELGRTDNAVEAWQTAWTRYPFSFYGYLARQRIVELGGEPASIEAGPQGDVADWFVDAAWSHSGAKRLVRLGLHEMAADLERARLDRGESTEDDRWRLGYLEHLAGRFSSSHNIARRAIDGRPWAEPEAGRRVRWSIAWPNPFERDILRAVVAERRQTRGREVLEPALPAAIMREESSFIEDIESWAGALGLMQLMPRTALAHDSDIDGEATPEKLKTALVNIRVGVDHLFSLARRFDSHPVLMAAAYNAGGGAVSKWLRRYNTDDIGLWVEDIPYDETRNYSKRVIGSYAAYQWLGGIDELDPAIAADPKR